VEATLHDDGDVTFRNVPAYRYRKGVALAIPGQRTIHGDIAWGGNWFFLISDHGQRIALDNVEALTDYTWKVRQTLEAQGITGEDGGVIDHIELFASDPSADSRNFVLCPGREYDRSPCGTGTSAKLACLAADDKLAPQQAWRQAGISGSEFTAYYEKEGDTIRPYIRGRAYLSADATLLIDENDFFAWRISNH
jgi:4-hydroxyproline epimerase